MKIPFIYRIYYGNRTVNSDPSSRQKDRDFIKRVLNWNYWLGFVLVGIRLKEERANKKAHLEVYEKWLGPEFQVEFESDYSLIISNHTGMFEIQYTMYKWAPGFIAKATLKSTPFVAFIADKLETLWLDRKDNSSRNQIAEEIKNRQEDYLAKKILTPLLVFPEGTTTSGNHILKFRKGAFEMLQPLKSCLFVSLSHQVAEGISPTPLQMLIDFSRFSHVFNFIELPVIYPTEFMYENFKKIHPEITNKAEVYAEVVREIWCEIGGFQKSDKNFNDFLNYISLVFDRNVRNT